MFNEMLLEKLQLILESIELIEERFSTIKIPDDLVLTAGGVMILDSISMRLQVIGEQIKGIDKLEPELFDRYSGIQWQNIMRLRDLISHHYQDIDHEMIFSICSSDLQPLKATLTKILTDIQPS